MNEGTFWGLGATLQQHYVKGISVERLALYVPGVGLRHVITIIARCQRGDVYYEVSFVMFSEDGALPITGDVSVPELAESA